MDVNSILFQCFTYGVPLSVAAALFGFRWQEGLWGNVVSLGVILFSALIAIGWWEPLAAFLSQNIPAMLFLADCISIWLIFLVSLLVLCEVTKLMSRVKVKFADPIEKAGNFIALTVMFLALYGFFLFTMDLGPVGENPDATVADDSPQIKILRILTAGNLSSFTNPRQFDDEGKFRKYHLERRKAITDYRKSNEDSLFYKGNVPSKRR